MIEVRPFDTLAGASRDWLNAKMHFDFAGLGRPDHVAIGALRVWNDDEFAPHSGFPMHGHTNVEIVTYVREGAITHEDSLGNKGRTEAGDVQVMSAGTGIRHSEFNAESKPTRLFQIWLDARTQGTAPHWNTRRFPKAARSGKLVALASGDPMDVEALTIDSDARVLGSTLHAGESAKHELGPNRRAYIVATSGRLEVNGVPMGPRDGAVVSQEALLNIVAVDDTELVVVEVS